MVSRLEVLRCFFGGWRSEFRWGLRILGLRVCEFCVQGLWRLGLGLEESWLLLGHSGKGLKDSGFLLRDFLFKLP